MINAISQIITTLGGVNPSSSKKNIPLIAPEIFIKEKSFSLPKDFLFFTQKYGASYFENWLEFTPKEKVPIAAKGNICSIGAIHGWNKSSDGIPNIYNRYSNQINKEYLPFADGSSGDYICIKVKGKNVGSIWYWHHESPEDNDLFLIADDFMTFLKSLSIQKDDGIDTSGYIGLSINPDDEFWTQFKDV